MNREDKIKNIMFDIYANNLNADNQFKIELYNRDEIDKKLIDTYSSIYVYMSPKKEILQLLGNYINSEGKQSKKLIYNFKNKLYGKNKKELNEEVLTEIFKKLHLFANLAEQLRLHKNLKKAEQEEHEIEKGLSDKIDQGKILKFLTK